MKNKFDMDYAPDRYWDTPEEVFANIKGTWRRNSIKEAAKSGEIEEVPNVMLEDTLDKTVRLFTGRLHPFMMGGEYLPDYLPGEVEIARVQLMSTTGDVFSIRARPAGSMIGYRVVDEYMEDHDSGYLKIHRSKTPLTMRRLAALINHSYLDGAYKGLGLVFGPLELNYNGGCDGETLRTFVIVSSEYYPGLFTCFDHQIAEWHSRVVNGTPQPVNLCAQVARKKYRGAPLPGDQRNSPLQA